MILVLEDHLRPSDNILNIDKNSEIYLLQEVQDEKYELLFGDGYFGKKLSNGDVITATYIITDGRDGNGASSFSFSGRLSDNLAILSYQVLQ